MASSDERGTPAYIVEAARRVMGGIDLDPASCAEANKVVQALHFYTREENGLQQPWYGRVFLNPPFSRPLCEQFVNKLVDAHNVQEAIVIVNQSTGKWYYRLLEQFPVVYPRHHKNHPSARVEFYPLSGNGRGTNNNAHGQAIFYLPPSNAVVGWFYEIFEEFCAIPWGVR